MGKCKAGPDDAGTEQGTLSLRQVWEVKNEIHIHGGFRNTRAGSCRQAWTVEHTEYAVYMKPGSVLLGHEKR